MGRAKDIRLEPISAQDANRIVKSLHYSGKVTQNSQLHLGVFLDGKCGGALQFGPPMDRRKVLPLVRGSKWGNMIELNRMALADWLPRNGESRALGVAFRILRKRYPQLKWVLSFADATQCGDGTIYRASGFVLTGVKRNTTLLRMPGGEVVADKTLNHSVDQVGRRGASVAKEAGATPIAGFQVRYIKFLDPAWRSRLTVPELPFTELDRLNARMVRGIPCGRSVDSDAPGYPPGEGGANPTRPLQTKARADGEA